MAKKKRKKKTKETNELFTPEFVKYLKSKAGPNGWIEPEKKDFDSSKRPHTGAEQVDEYRLAQARRIIRLHNEWQAMRN
jgi:hypothetical protein